MAVGAQRKSTQPVWWRGVGKGMFKEGFLEERAFDFQGQVGLSWAKKIKVQGEKRMHIWGT